MLLRSFLAILVWSSLTHMIVLEEFLNIVKPMKSNFCVQSQNWHPIKHGDVLAPPAVTNRWCCSVHKTSPQVRLLQHITGISDFTGMAFTGVRGDESVARSEYEDVSLGGKHQGQYSCHPIIEWNSAELFNYIYANDLCWTKPTRKVTRARLFGMPNVVWQTWICKETVVYKRSRSSSG